MKDFTQFLNENSLLLKEPFEEHSAKIKKTFKETNKSVSNFFEKYFKSLNKPGVVDILETKVSIYNNSLVTDSSGRLFFHDPLETPAEEKQVLRTFKNNKVDIHTICVDIKLIDDITAEFKIRTTFEYIQQI